MTITQDNYLDFGNLLINELFGDVTLFIIAGIVAITYYGFQGKLEVPAILALNVLFIGLVTAYYYNAFLWIVTLILIGLIVYSIYPKIIKR